ncbi:MAG: hypothetical protein SFW67_20965 [Myxococcaceae bacterium]|nr:hypothetical protein [Myxococcaceae bacterium]
MVANNVSGALRSRSAARAEPCPALASSSSRVRRTDNIAISAPVKSPVTSVSTTSSPSSSQTFSALSS